MEMETLEQTLQVNEFARKCRHLKNFSRGGLVRMNIGYLFSSAWNSTKRLVNNPLFAVAVKTLGVAKEACISALPASPQRRLLAQSIFIAGTALIVTSLSSGATFTPAEMSYSSDYLSTYTLPGDVLVSDDSGYLVKVNPPTDESNRIGLTDYAVHTVQGGETMSAIAKKYSVKVETVMWENNIINSNTLRTGQKLLIPPVDGVSYKVANGENIEKIAKKYSISADSIIAQNGLDKDLVYKGQELFLPGAKPIQTPNLVIGRNPVASRSYRSTVSATSSTATPDIGKMFIFPTIGSTTQGFRSGHYALDIGNRAMPPIWAASGGTVVKASSGTWGGGYGTHVIVDHGNGVKSLYAHMDSLNVSEGQWINQGDVIGIMGNTGRVYGATGIHLHWEVIVNGVKVNPNNYF